MSVQPGQVSERETVATWGLRGCEGGPVAMSVFPWGLALVQCSSCPSLGSATEAQGAGAQLQGSGSQAALGTALSLPGVSVDLVNTGC